MTPCEGVPVWAVVDRHGVVLPNSNEAAELACFYTKDEADEELTYANQGEGAPPWESRKPFVVTRLCAHPAATAREEAIRAEVIEECARVCDEQRCRWCRDAGETNPNHADCCASRDDAAAIRALALARSTGGAS